MLRPLQYPETRCLCIETPSDRHASAILQHIDILGMHMCMQENACSYACHKILSVPRNAATHTLEPAGDMCVTARFAL